jgi:hypothetical protein
MKKLFTIWLYVLAGGTLGVSLLSGPLQHTGAHAATPKGKRRVQELEAQLTLAQADLATCSTDRDAAIAAQSELTVQVSSLEAELETTRAQLAENQATLAGTQDLLDKCIKRFHDNSDGTVTDMATGLMWQKDTADVNDDGQVDSADTLLWNDAFTYCENLSFAGHDDWRLPQQRELFSIIDVNRTNPAIDPVFGALSVAYWSSFGDGPPDVSWYVEFSNGTSKPVLRSISLNYVRAVRSGP